MAVVCYCSHLSFQLKRDTKYLSPNTSQSQTTHAGNVSMNEDLFRTSSNELSDFDKPLNFFRHSLGFCPVCSHMNFQALITSMYF